VHERGARNEVLRGLGARGPGASAGDVLRLIRTGTATTPAELARVTRLSRGALDSRLEQLLSRGLVVAEAAPSTGGRPPRRFAISHRAGVVLAADLGATHSRVAIADLGGATLAARTFNLEIAAGPHAVLDRVLALADDLLDGVGHGRADIWATGVGVPGPVDFASGRPVRPPIMPGWDGFDIRGWFSAHIPGRVLVDNDVNVMALGEYSRVWTDDVTDLLYVKVGTGIGAGLISDGSVFRGARGAAGDIGHVQVRSTRQVVCDCGNEGCLEALASGRAIARDLRERGLDTASTRDVVDLVDAGQPDAARAVRDAGRYLGEALAAAVNLLNPEVIVIGGDLSAAHDQLLAGVREVVYQRSTALATQLLRIEQSRLGEDAGIAGCVVLALDDLFAPETIDELVSRVTEEETA
jgi:predicted NBD/HSP70 family sugar kinase